MIFSRLVQQTTFDMEALLQTDESWVLVLDEQLEIQSCNGGAASILGLGKAKLQGGKLNELVRLGHLEGLLRGGYCFRSQPLFIGDRKLICHHVPRIEGGVCRGGVLAIDRDLLPMDDLAFVDLFDIVRSLSVVMDLAYEGTILVDAEGVVVLVNQPFADVLGTRAQDMVGKHIHKAYPNSRLSRLPVVMKTGKAEIGWPHELNGREVVVCRYPLIKHGRPIGALGKILFQDVREVIQMVDKFQAMSSPLQPPKAPQVTKLGDFTYDINNIIGHSKIMKSLKETLLKVADRSSNVLLGGESGTGKELFAHAIHAASRRRHGPFIKMNCAAIPEHLLESELFGYVDGAFTGARKGGQLGKFELAHNGTIFLDEISDMSMPMQAKLLRILQEKELSPLGSNSSKRVDVRIVAATNVKLQEQVASGKFREDLYYRLNVVSLCIPPLRERTEDICFIVNHLIETFNQEFGLEIQGLEADTWEVLMAYEFPGNIRELRNIVESAFNVVDGPFIRREDLPAHLRHVRPPARDQIPLETSQGPTLGESKLSDIMDHYERKLLEQALEEVVSRPGFYKKLQRYKMM